MDPKLKKTLKVLAFVTALALIGAIVYVTVAMNGDPVSKFIARRASVKYVEAKIEKQFEGTEYEGSFVLGPTNYSFKDGGYHTHYTSSKSEDLYFSVHWYHNGRISDNIDDALSGQNTYMRLNMEFDEYMENLMAQKLPYATDMVLGDLDKTGKYSSYFTLDTKLDVHNLAGKPSLTVYVFDNDMSWGGVAELLLECKAIMDEEDIPIALYTCVIRPIRTESNEEKHYESIGVYDFPASDIISGENLPQILKEHYENWERESSK